MDHLYQECEWYPPTPLFFNEVHNNNTTTRALKRRSDEGVMGHPLARTTYDTTRETFPPKRFSRVPVLLIVLLNRLTLTRTLTLTG